MRLISKIAGLTCLLAIVSVVPAMAQGFGVPLQLLDPDGNPLTECSGTVYSGQLELIQKLRPNPNGSYVVDVVRGQKVVFEIGEPGTGVMLFDAIVPEEGPWVLTLLGPPVNDDCAAAIPLALPSTVSGDTSGASGDAAPFCGTSNTAPGVWYSVAGSGNNVTVSTCSANTGYDTKLSVYCQGCTELLCVGGNDDDFGCPTGGLQSTVTFCTEAGAEYQVLVHGFSSNAGPFELSGSEGGPCGGAVACLPPEPVGACCNCLNAPFNCTQETEGDCATLGGDWQGADVPCFGSVPGLSSSPAAGIPDNNAGGITDTIVVADVLTIGNLDIDVAIDHTWAGDLIIEVTSPSGTVVRLWDRNCGSSDDVDVTFDDDAADVDCSSPISGTFNPASAGGGTLSAFTGEPAAGVWTIFVSDNAGADTGTLDSWALVIPTTATCPDSPGGGTCPGDDENADDESETNLPTNQLPVSEGGVTGGSISLGEGAGATESATGSDSQETEVEEGSRSSGIRRNTRRGR